MAVSKAGAEPKAQALEDAEESVLQEVKLSDLSHMTVNLDFLSRAWRIIRLGLRSPMSDPWLWLVILLNYGFQICGAYVLQSQLYIVATGRDAKYPGLAGCLKSGCGGVKAAPGSRALIREYYGEFFWMFAVSMAFVVLMSFSGDIINTLMRRNSANNIQHRLLHADKLLYRLTVDGTMDGVDQRMTSDLQVVLDGFTCVLFGNSADYLAYPVAFMCGRFSFSLNNIFLLPEVQSSALRGNIVGIVLAAVGVAITAYLLPINHVSRIFYRGQKYEGNFRTTHTRAVLNCEQITTLRGEPAERALADQQYRCVDANNRIYYFWQGVLLILRLFVTICIPAVSYMCLGITGITNATTANFFQKQVGDVLEYMLYFPVLVMRLAFACGATHRVGQLLEQMDRLEKAPLVTRIEFESKRVELVGVRANPPEKLESERRARQGKDGKGKAVADPEAPRRFLFDGVSLRVEHGQSVCIMGPSGCGKSSLLRVIAGLWGTEEGRVVRPQSVGKGGIFFLPQRPYVFPGTLQAQLEYPDPPSSDGGAATKIAEVLRLMRLDGLITRYGLQAEVNWDAVLSTGEMQRLSAARMFFHEPAFCLADECTSALDLKMESFIYRQCAERGISMISVAHRPTVIPHHDFVFKYTAPTHSWNLVPAAEVSNMEKFPIDGLGEGETSQRPEEATQGDGEGGFGRLFCIRLFRALRLGMRSCGSQGVIFLLIMLCCMGVYGAVVCIVFKHYGTSVIISKITGTGGYKRDIKSALNMAGVIIGLNSICSVVQALSAFLGALLAVKVQRGIIARFHSSYFSPGVLYHTNRIMKEQGVDQRMVQDLSGLRESLGWIFGNPFSFCNYRVGALPLLIVWVILMAYAFTNTWQLTVFLLIFMVASYAAQLFTAIFTSRIVEKRQSAEGDLRLHLGRVLQNIESITFFGGQDREYARAERDMGDVTYQRLKYSCLANASSFPTIIMYYWLQTGIYVMAAVVQVNWAPGAIPPKDLFTTINFNIIWSKISELIIMCLGGIGTVVGYTHRVMRVMERVELATQQVATMQAAIKTTPGKIAFDHVSIALPAADPKAASLIVKDLSFSVPESLSVMGLGKSSAARALAGMWPTASGTISRPAWGRDGIFFVPQSNYATQGTLAAQVVYPLLEADVRPSDAELLGILEDVGLGYIADRWGLHRVVNWDMVLSGGECQRLGFARVLYQKPRFAVLDETTSALDMALEQRCMQALTGRRVELLSFASRPSVQAYHNQNMLLQQSHAKTQTTV